MPDCDGAELGRLIIADETLNSTRLILLTSSGQRGDGQLFAGIGFAAYLLKPVAQRDLTECLMLILANTADSWHLQSQPMITCHALRAQRVRTHNRILLAEDNLVNQKVALRFLEKLDFKVDVVGDGQAALAAWQSGDFDLILMDCQMPRMDGYEATQEIRKLEAGKRHIPIVALTAHAMKGAEEKCRAAGMDAYLAKPLDRAKLEACLDRLLPSMGTTGPNIAIKEAAPPITESVLDAAVLARLGDLMGEDLADVIESYVSDTSVQIVAMEAAFEQRDLVVLGRCAHSLMSSSEAVGAVVVRSISEVLESHARAGGGLDEAGQFIATVRAAFEVVKPKLQEIIAAENTKTGRAGAMPAASERMLILLAEDD
jgi:CheY-like chemotaxis protein